MTMSIKREKYVKYKLDKTGHYLEFNEQVGHPIDYEVLVDHQRVVGRTKDCRHFWQYQNYVDGSTAFIEVIFHTGQGTCEKHVYHVQEDVSGDEVIVQQEVQQLLTVKLRDLQQENDGLRQEIRELKTEVLRWRRRV